MVCRKNYDIDGTTTVFMGEQNYILFETTEKLGCFHTEEQQDDKFKSWGVYYGKPDLEVRNTNQILHLNAINISVYVLLFVFFTSIF